MDTSSFQLTKVCSKNKFYQFVLIKNICPVQVEVDGIFLFEHILELFLEMF